MKSGGDESCFLFNVTQNLRFDTLRSADIAARDLPVFTSTVLASGEVSDADSEEAPDKEQFSDEESAVGFGQQQKPHKQEEES
jgi:hypothetical protein